MYSIVSFIPAPGANCNKEGIYGYVTVKDCLKSLNCAEHICKDLTDSDINSTMCIVKQNEYIPCINCNKITEPTNVNFDRRIQVNVLHEQLNIFNKILGLVTDNISKLHGILMNYSESSKISNIGKDVTDNNITVENIFDQVD